MENKPSRIMLFGRPGSGKSTFANALHKITGLPLHHLDKYYFVENWVERDRQEFLDIQQSIVDTDSWIIDGNSIKSLEMRYAKADLVLYVNFPRWICLYRILKRILFPNTKINDRAEGCRDSLSWKLLEYTWTFDQRVEKSIEYLCKKYPDIKFVKIRNDRILQNLKLSFVKNNLFS
jgi:adenylate kinase family enzyme